MDLLSPGRITEIRLDLTTRCNLRCVYCAVSLPNYVGADMSDEAAFRCVEAITSLMRYNPPHPVTINGHGETTFMPSWVPVCKELVARNIPVRITSNLAKQYSAAEIDLLACMQTIGVSIDTPDAKLLARMRRKVSLRRIVDNIAEIRAASARLKRKEPIIHLGCGLYDKSATTVEDFAEFAIGLRAGSVYFWNLAVHDPEFPNVPAADKPVPLDRLEDEELRPKIESIRKATARLASEGIAVQVGGGFIDILARRVGL